MIDSGDYDEISKYLNDDSKIHMKNKLLKTIYRRIKQDIRELTYTQEAKAYLDYIALKNKIESFYVFLLFNNRVTIIMIKNRKSFIKLVKIM